jgi:hypothetical protein
MSKKIIDQFTDLLVSRERKRQLRKMADGLCIQGACKSKSVTWDRCHKHQKEMKDRQSTPKYRRYYRNYNRRKFGWKPWRPGGSGRPPISS